MGHDPTGRTLRGKDEREEDERHLLVGVLADLLGDDLLDPRVEEAVGLLALAHRLLRRGGSSSEVLDGDLARAARVPHLGAGEGEGEVDELERLRDQPVLVRDLLGSSIGDVAAAEDPETGDHVEVAELHLVRLVVRVLVGEPLLEEVAVDLVLHAEVDPV